MRVVRECQPDPAGVFLAVECCQRLTFARSGYAFAAFDQEQRAMSRAANQTAAGVKEPVGFPFQRHASVRAAVLVYEDLAGAADGEDPIVIQVKTAALRFGKLV